MNKIDGEHISIEEVGDKSRLNEGITIAKLKFDFDSVKLMSKMKQEDE